MTFFVYVKNDINDESLLGKLYYVFKIMGFLMEIKGIARKIYSERHEGIRIMTVFFDESDGLDSNVSA